MTPDPYIEAVNRIIAEQAAIIGPLAMEQAKKVAGLHVNPSSHKATIEGDKAAVLQKLVEQYEKLFGRASVEVCRQAAHELLTRVPADQVPALLR